MVLIGALVNGLAILFGGGVGLFLKKGLSDRIGTAVMNALSLCVLYIGISGVLQGDNVLMVIIAMVLGTLIGESLDLNAKINQIGAWFEVRLLKPDSSDGPSISQGFVTASLVFCVGAMAIVGSLQSGLSANHDTLFAKSLIDGIAAIIMASSLGFGVLLSGILVFSYQASITLLASFLAPLLTETVINDMTCIGSLLIIGLALNMLKITDLKVMNFSPAVFLPIILSLFL